MQVNPRGGGGEVAYWWICDTVNQSEDNPVYVYPRGGDLGALLQVVHILRGDGACLF